MSMSLILWKAPLAFDLDEAEALLQAWYDRSDDSAFEPSEDIAKVSEELSRRYPDDRESQQSEARHSPWSEFPFWESERLLALSLRWDADYSVIRHIVRLARKHELLLYDPQGPDIYLPFDPCEGPSQVPKPTLFDHLKALAFVAVGLAVTYSGYVLQVPILRWAIMGVGGFFTIAAMIVVFASFGNLETDEEY